MSRIPTTSLAAERDEIIARIRSLPPESQINILAQMPEDQLFNMCLVSEEYLNLCLDPFMLTARNWTKMDRYIFILQLLHRCKNQTCKNYRPKFEQELKNDPEFMANYNLVIININIKVTNFKVGNNIIDTLINTSKLTFNDTFNQIIDLRLFIGLRFLTFKDVFNQDITNKLPINLKNLKIGNSFNQPIDLRNLTLLQTLYLRNDFNQDITNKLPIKVFDEEDLNSLEENDDKLVQDEEYYPEDEELVYDY